VKNLLAGLAGTLFFVLVLPPPAAAQTRELAGGVSFQKWLSGWDESKGFAVDFAQTLRTTPHTAFSIVADLGVNFFPNEETDTGLTGGARLRFLPAKRFSPFAQATAGVMHWSETFPLAETGNDPMVGGGGGVQIRLTGSFGVKAQYDFWRSWSSRFEEWSWITRLYVGGVYSFGRRP
jgi:hypothetical protein